MNQIEALKKMIEIAKKAYELAVKKAEIVRKGARVCIYETAKACIGKDMAPIHGYYGCVEALGNVFRKAFAQELGENSSTDKLYQLLKKDTKRFQRIFAPLPGDIIISPSNWGNGMIKNGHVGIISDDEKIMSNNSEIHRWDEHWTIPKWKSYFYDMGHFPVDYFRIL